MAFTYVLSESRGLVRLLITDISVEQPLFDDAEIDAFLSLKGGSVKRAAALALDTIASNESLVYKRIKTLDISTDGPGVAADLRKHASQLRAEAQDDDDQAADGAFDIAEMVIGPFAARERIWNQGLRDAAP